jgi:hypothetical protein
VTTCPFALNVRSEFLSERQSSGVPPANVTAYSPVTKKTYHLTCVLFADRTAAECNTGTASLAFPLEGHHQAPESSESESEDGGSSSEGEASGEGGGGEDAVGSPSHAGDQQFCEEHTCIGNFTTEPGTVVECSDGTYSHSGGISGACSDHGGEASDE